MCLLRETGEEDGLLGQGVLKMCIETADAGLDLYLPFFIYEEYMVNRSFEETVKNISGKAQEKLIK